MIVILQDMWNFLSEVDNVDMQKIYAETPGADALGNFETFRESVLKHMVVSRFGRPTVFVWLWIFSRQRYVACE